MPDGQTDNLLLRDGMPLVTRAMPYAPSSYDPDTREFEFVASTETPVLRYDRNTGRQYFEVLRANSWRLERVETGVPILNSHRSWNVEDAVGKVLPGSARAGSGELTLRGRLTSADDAAPVRQRFEDGTVTTFSVGYTTGKEPIEVIAPNERKGESIETRVYEATLYECSLVPINADLYASARSAAAERETPAQEQQMSEQTKPAEVVDLDAVRSEAQAAERKRVSEITALARSHGYDAGKHVDAGDSVDAVRAAILDAKLAAQAQTEVRGTHGAGVRVGKSHTEQVVEGIENAIAHRAAPKGQQIELTDAGRSFRAMSLGRMAETLLREQGVDVGMMSEREIGKAAMRIGAHSVSATRSFPGAHTSGDFPYILANVANKFLLAGYGAEPMTHDAFSYTRSIRDLKQVSTVRLGSVAALPKVVEGAEYTYATIGEEREVYTVAKYGQILPFTLEMVINDDLSAFNMLAEEMGRAAGRTELDLVYGSSGVFGSNSGAGEAMGDGNNLFDASNHDNQVGAHTALSTSGIAALRLLLRNQTDVNGNRINLSPSILLVPAALETTAEQILNGISMPITDATAQVPAFRGLQLVVEPRIDDINNGTAAYYLMSNRPWVELGKLAGYESPQFETIEQMDADQIGYKVRYFCAAKATDWRQVARDPGA